EGQSHCRSRSVLFTLHTNDSDAHWTPGARLLQSSGPEIRSGWCTDKQDGYRRIPWRRPAGGHLSDRTDHGCRCAEAKHGPRGDSQEELPAAEGISLSNIWWRCL